MSSKPERLTLEELERLEYMTPEDGIEFLAGYELSEYMMTAALKRVGRKLENTPDKLVSSNSPSYDPSIRNFRAAAHLLGASFNQIGQLYDVAPQTVISSINRILPSKVRAGLRLRTTLSLEALSTYKDNFERNKDYLNRLPPRQLAEWLAENTELDNEL